MRTDVKILGKTYTVRSEYDQAFMNETADLVNGKMRELMDKLGALPTEKVAILTAMNLAGEFLRLKKDSDKVKESLGHKARKLLDLVESHL